MDKVSLLFIPILAAGSLLTDESQGQSFKVMHSFTAATGQNLNGAPANADGARPEASFLLIGDAFYATTSTGGSAGWGTLYSVNLRTEVFTKLHDFDAVNDGSFPSGALLLEGNAMYGTATSGGMWGGNIGGYGTVFEVNPDGTDFSALHVFPGGADGIMPYAGLIFGGNSLFGTTYVGGDDYNGTVFTLNIDGSGFKVLHAFSATSTNSFGVYTNSDGTRPRGNLVLVGNALYGTASAGGLWGAGTVFSLNTDGTGFTNLHSFTAGVDGATPNAGVILSGDTLYGTAVGGGLGSGVIFALNTDGTGFRILYNLNKTDDGANPQGLMLLGSNLYGAASSGGSAGWGTVFSVKTDGTGFTNLHSFDFVNDGASPFLGLISSASLYGATLRGASADFGTLFKISLLPQLNIARLEANVVLTWPTNYAGFDFTGYTLQSTTNLVSPLWTTNLPAPVVVNRQNVVTNPVAGTQQFFRLSQ